MTEAGSKFTGVELPQFGEWQREYSSISDDSQNPKPQDALKVRTVSRHAFDGLKIFSERDEDYRDIKLRAGSVIANTIEMMQQDPGVIYGVAVDAGWMVKKSPEISKFLGLDISGGLLALDGTDGFVLPSGVKEYLSDVEKADIPELVRRGSEVFRLIENFRDFVPNVAFDEYYSSLPR